MSSKGFPDVKGVTLELRPSGILQVTMDTPKTYNSFDDQRCEQASQF